VRTQNNGRMFSPFELDERAAEAAELLNHPLMGEALDSIHGRYLGILVQSNVGSPEAITAQVGLQVISFIRAHLQSVINDKKMNDKYSAPMARVREKNDG
jgi:hypothetical protein